MIGFAPAQIGGKPQQPSEDDDKSVALTEKVLDKEVKDAYKHDLLTVETEEEKKEAYIQAEKQRKIELAEKRAEAAEEEEDHDKEEEDKKDKKPTEAE